MTSSLFDVLFQGSQPANTTGGTSTSTSFPDWYQQVIAANIGNAAQVVNTPYQVYPGQRIADQTPDQIRAQQDIRQSDQATQPMFDAAAQKENSATGGLNQSNFNSFLSPYTSGVVNSIATLGNQNLMENVLPQVQNQFIGSGQNLNGTSSGDQTFTDRAIRDSQASISNAQAGALEQSYNNAMNNYGTAQNQQLQAGNNLGTLAGENQVATLGGAAALNASGQSQQAQQQGNLSLAYQDFLNQQGNFASNASFFNSVVQGTPINQTSVSNNSSPATDASVKGTGAGALSTGTGLGGQLATILGGL